MELIKKLQRTLGLAALASNSLVMQWRSKMKYTFYLVIEQFYLAIIASWDQVPLEKPNHY